MKVEIFTRGNCQYSEAALRLLRKQQVDHEQVELTDELAAEIKDRTGRVTTPIVFIDGVYVGGFDELVELDQDGEL